MGIAIMPKGILKSPIQISENSKRDEISVYEVDIFKSRETEKLLKNQIEFEFGTLQNSTEFTNGKIYENDELIYEGEYLRGIAHNLGRWYPHGYGKAYYGSGALEYEGNFVYGHPHGYGEYYYMNGQLRWKGNFEAVTGIKKVELWRSALGYVDRKGRIKYGKAYDVEGNLTHYGYFDSFGKPKNS